MPHETSVSSGGNAISSSVATKTMGTYTASMRSVNSCVGDLLACASSTMRMTRASVVSPAGRVTTISRRPSPLIEPAKTSSPGALSTGTLSPVIGASLSADRPSSIRPSKGTRSNGRTTTRAPTATSSTGTVDSRPCWSSTDALSGATSVSALIDRRARLSARCSPAAPSPNRKSRNAPSS